MVDGFKPVTVILCEDPATNGAGSPIASVAEPQLPLSIIEVEYLKSYTDAVPVIPSSPVAVQERSIELCELVIGADAARLLMAAGEMVSGVA